MKEIERLQKLIDESDNIVFFGGAGVSTESGIKDFRSADGLYNMKFEYPAEVMLSSYMFYLRTDKFYEFYKEFCSQVKSYTNSQSKKKSCQIKTSKIFSLFE